MNDFNDSLKGANRELLGAIWRSVKDGVPLTGENAVLAQLMLEHEEYTEDWDAAANSIVKDYDPETESNPFLHITFHTVIENQLRDNEPKGVKKVFDRLMTQIKDRHEVIHRIAVVAAGEIFNTMKYNRPFDGVLYLKKLKKLGR
ncbi:DUF1841 family protein [candidate division KSB1 bacterium]|nr:DUF1841 family protein [candidate division KSB1 bacterium]